MQTDFRRKFAHYGRIWPIGIQLVEDSQIGERAGRRPKTDRTRRSWSTREEEALMLALKDLVVNKWESDNEFRGGYLARIEEIIKHNNARYMRFKSWPLFDEWKEIFGKDRATRSSGVRSHLNVGNGSQEAEFEASADGHSGTNTDNTTSSQGMPVNTMGSGEMPDQSTGDSNKRKLVDRADALLELLAKGQDETNARLDKLAGRIGFEFDASKARKKVFGMLGNIQGITLGQQIDAAEFILSKVEHLDLFNSLPGAIL
ncbi:hypothetical protein SASPL_117292 [Salvia splendens]|uniref:Myb/SANT-like domain-containing protein n=1 Tax=Salvia splendens TaxID=180675 RepID=A0A8X8XX98_SALSN|nr:hypothetical protein SASPL_117292 [Salvia splendens]